MIRLTKKSGVPGRDHAVSASAQPVQARAAALDALFA